MSLPEKKVLQLVDLMNSMSSANIPAKKPILEMFDIAMDEKMLDYLIAMGTKPHTIGQLRNGYHKMYGGTKEDWEAFKTSPLAPKLDRIWLLTTKATKLHWDATFQHGDGLLFGAEDCGCPQYVHDDIGEKRIKIPQFAPNLRSLNLSTSAGIASYEAMRQITHT